MKFSHGVWTMRDGVVSIPAERVAEQRVDGGVLHLVCLNRPPAEKLNTYALSVRVSSPLPDVIRIQVSHRQGKAKRGPSFVIEDTGPAPDVSIVDTDDEIRFTTGGLSARIAKKSFEISFFDGDRLLTRSPKRGLSAMQVSGATGSLKSPSFVGAPGEYLMQRLLLGVGECVYGLGERFGPFVKNGQSIPMWNEDPGTETDLSYKNVPLYVTNQGYGIFVASPARIDFEVATERTSAMQMSSSETELDYYVFLGPTPKGVIEKYARLTGLPALPPAWSFGLWLSTSFLTDYDEKIVTKELVDGMAERDIPFSVFHYDCLWMREHHWCDFEWDPAKFPDPRGMLARLHERGLKVCVWINSYISELSKLFPEGRDKGYFLKTQSGDVYQRDDWQPAIAIVDFTNPAAVAWYQGELQKLLDMGVDCFKTDFGERIPPDAVYADGSDPERMHNYYPYLYNQAVFQLLERHKGKGGAVVFARSATAGSQKFPVHWGGDCDSTFESMAETLRGGLSFAMSGGAFWSHDISGFSGTAPAVLYKRWVAFGLFSSHSRLHGAWSYRVPWKFDEESVDVLRFFTRLKHRLMPYVWGLANAAHATGVPLMRPMVLEFPNDPGCHYLDKQYMLGDSLLVAPILNDLNRAEYYLPKGRWTDFFTGEIVEGGSWRKEENVSVMRIPLFVREGTLLATGTRDDKAVYDYPRELLLQLFELADGASATATVFDVEGREAASFKAERRGITVTISSSRGVPAGVLLRGVSKVGKIVNGSAEPRPDGLLVSFADPTRPIEIALA